MRRIFARNLQQNEFPSRVLCTTRTVWDGNSWAHYLGRNFPSCYEIFLFIRYSKYMQEIWVWKQVKWKWSSGEKKKINFGWQRKHSIGAKFPSSAFHLISVTFFELLLWRSPKIFPCFATKRECFSIQTFNPYALIIAMNLEQLPSLWFELLFSTDNSTMNTY